ncbi:HD-GYP domain-containing protein [Thermovenabulum gondwanense]|uniref:Cyclic di-GMP phosphodiesterase response regulator RpfG n=1 Tax=Thermovenabulum gondwanense TaxID=520767 RepID=A0A162ML68_9FIRM|nr:HD domain-containing phosphohydrolase [Thermovenabulum gondwanense]KYO66542.1 Cyclic di-GMP phosphodiesterase response regulator RpfG [Thermovenabulum gondwanense]
MGDKKVSKFFWIYFLILVAIALYFLYISIITFPLHDISKLSSLVIFTTMLILGELLSVTLPNQTEITVGFAINTATILIFGFKFSTIIAFIAVTATELKRIKIMPLYKSILNICIFVIMVSVSGFIYEKLGGSIGNINIYSDFLKILLMIAIYFFINVGLILTVVYLLYSKSMFFNFLNIFIKLIPNYFSLGFLGVLLAIIYVNVGILGVILFLIPLLVARHSFKLYMDMRKTYLDTIKALANALEAKDPYTRGHSERVAKLAVAIAEDLNLSQDLIQNLNYAAILHDIGKIGIPEIILNKPGKLSDEEFAKIKEHPVKGASITNNVDFLSQASLFILHHHERLNGSGYPKGLKGAEIPLGAAIIAVADVYDALTTDRPYRNALSPQEAFKEIEINKGVLFKEEVVDALKRVLEKREELKECV